jgi:sec-independent protein translocase protein TatC
MADHQNEEELGGSMSFLEHLEELRHRLFYALAGVFAGFFVAFYFHDRIWALTERPILKALAQHGNTHTLVYHNPLDPFNLYIKLSLIAGLFLASPWVLYQVWLFISPGLYRRERRYVVPFVLSTSALFLSGGLFAYLFAFPIVLNFLIGYAHGLQPLIEINEYFSLFATVVLGLGLVFELPTLIFFLAVMGLVNARMLLRNFRYAILIVFVIAAIITPTSDVTTMLVFAAPMLVLYFVSIGVAWAFGRDRRVRGAKSASA